MTAGDKIRESTLCILNCHWSHAVENVLLLCYYVLKRLVISKRLHYAAVCYYVPLLSQFREPLFLEKDSLFFQECFKFNDSTWMLCFV